MRAKKAFTLPELLTAIVIIVILVGVLLPALAQIKKLAKDTKQKAQLASIEMGLNLYKNDFGEYPPSHGYINTGTYAPADYTYCGAQTLAEAMFGQDLLGFHPDSVFRANGCKTDNCSGANDDLYPDNLDPDNDPDDKANLESRKDPYLARENISLFTPRQIFDRDTSSLPLRLEPDRYVICDVFATVSRVINGKTYKIGTPILYFRANPSAIKMTLEPHNDPLELVKNIYNWADNYRIVYDVLGRVSDGKRHPLCTVTGDKFYGYIGDTKIPHINRPVRPDSFLLISAGDDGLFGTKDDICNFEPNLPG